METALAYDSFLLMKTVISNLHIEPENPYRKSLSPADVKTYKQCLDLYNEMNPNRKTLRDMFSKVQFLLNPKVEIIFSKRWFFFS